VNRKVILIIAAVVGGFLLLIGAIIAVVFYATSGVTGAADKFYETARGGDPKEVYALTSAQLHQVTTPDQLAAYIQANRFDQVADTSWSSRSIENNTGRVEGTLTLDDGGTIPVTMELAKEGDDWKVSFIEIGPAGLSGGKTK
jgi:hypothetical protein